MGRPKVIILMAVFLTGCYSSQIIPSKTTAASIHKIAIIPIESPRFYVSLSHEEQSRLSSMHLVNDPSFANSEGGKFLDVMSNIRSVINFDFIFFRRKLPSEGGYGFIEDLNAERWIPTVNFAESALLTMRQAGYYDVVMVDSYAKLPIADSSIKTDNKRETDQVTRWYNEDISTVDYTKLEYKQFDTVIEVGLLSYWYYDSHLMIQVGIKMVDLSSKKVIGRQRHLERPRANIISALSERNSDELKQLIINTGSKAVNECIKDIGFAVPERVSHRLRSGGSTRP